ncbi:unnamed protein product [Hymenolepis diminuta]|uniref:Uncharacterized protein n=1 Tax=Hymenolepis diminuta TaxID=6216 RepID=A0A564YTV7_HYMDI|nr:unnamed protein product [Hymenolepis diminuta]
MTSDSSYLLPASTKESERLYKFTILTPHTFLPPHHSESLEDDLAEEFARYLCGRVRELLGERSYTPHGSGEAFLNIRFDEFEEKFLRHSEYAIFITSGQNAASLDIIYPRMLVFLTIRPTWRNRGMVIYLGPPEGQKVFDPNLFLTNPLIFPLNPGDWDSAEDSWEALLGRLQAQVPLTPEPMKSKQRIELLPIKIASASANENAATSPSYPPCKSAAHIVGPIRTKKAKYSKLSTLKFIQLFERGNSTRLFVSPLSLSSTTRQSPFRQSPFRQLESRYSIHRSVSADDMCFYTRHSKKKSATISKKPKEKQRRNSESALSEKSKTDLLCIFSGLRSPKIKRKEGGKQKESVVQTPEVIRIIAPEIEDIGFERKPLHAQCLQVQTGDEILERRFTPYNTISTSPTKRKTNILSSGRRTRTRWDSGIVSNYSLGSTEINTSYPSLYLHHNFQQTTTVSPQSFLSNSSPSYLDGHSSRWAYSSNQKSSHGVSSIHTDSSIEEQRGNDLEGSLKFADEENLADTTILSDKSGLCEISPFIKPGIPPLKNSIYNEEETMLVKIESPLLRLIMNPDSNVSTDSAGDPTISQEYFNKLPNDSILKAKEEDYDYAIKPQVTQYEQAVPHEITSEVSDSRQENVIEERTTHIADFFIRKTADSIQQSEPVDIQNPLSSVDSVDSGDHQSIFSSSETVIYGGHTMSMEIQNASPIETSTLPAKVQKNELDENQECEAVNEDLTLERNYNLHSNRNSEITENVFDSENPIEIPVTAIPCQPTIFKTEEALLKESIVQLRRNNSSESEEITVRENKPATKPSSNLKRESTVDDQSSLELESDSYQISTTEFLPYMSRNVVRSFEASRDSGLHSIGSSDITILEHSSLCKEGLISNSEELDSLTNSPQKVLTVMEEAPKVNGKYSTSQVPEGMVFATVIIGGHSIPYGQSHQDMCALSSQNEISIMEKSTDSGIHSAVSTLRKSTASTSASVTDDTDQDLDTSERISELANQETIEITSHVHQKAQIVDEVLPLVTPVREIPVSGAVRYLIGEISPLNKTQSESERKTEVKEAADIQPIITPTQEIPISTAILGVKKEIVPVSQTQNESKRLTEFEEITDVLPIITPVQEIPVSAAVRDINKEIASVNQALQKPLRIREAIDTQPIIAPIQEVPLFAAFFGTHEESPLENMDLSERIQDSVHQSSIAPKVENTYSPSYLETDIELIDTSPGLLVIQSRTRKSSTPSTESIKEQLTEKGKEIEKELSSSADSFDIEKSYDKRAYEIVSDMLGRCSPETLKLVQTAVLTYDRHPKFDKSIKLDQRNHKQVIVSTTEDVQLNSEIVQQSPNSLWNVIPQVSVALINLSTAYIPRYISTIYDYSMSLIRPDHPDKNLRQITTSAQEAFLNHPLGMPVLLAGTTLISPWVIRQFPLTIMATCQEAPDVLRRLFENPGNFLAEHLADMSEVFQATPTWSAFAIIGSRGTHWRRLRPTI